MASGPRRRYTKREKAQAVGIASLTSAEAAAEELGIPRRTIGYWMDRPEFAELRQKTRDQVADEMWAVIQIGVQELAKGLREEAPLRDKATAVGILYDKHALLMGMATSRSESRDLTGTMPDADLITAVDEADAITSARRVETADQEPAEA